MRSSHLVNGQNRRTVDVYVPRWMDGQLDRDEFRWPCLVRELSWERSIGWVSQWVGTYLAESSWLCARIRRREPLAEAARVFAWWTVVMAVGRVDSLFLHLWDRVSISTRLLLTCWRRFWNTGRTRGRRRKKTIVIIMYCEMQMIWDRLCYYAY